MMILIILLIIAVSKRSWGWFYTGAGIWLVLLLIGSFNPYATGDAIAGNWLAYSFVVVVFAIVMCVKINSDRNKIKSKSTPEGTDSFDKVASWYKPGLEQQTDNKNENKEQQ